MAKKPAKTAETESLEPQSAQPELKAKPKPRAKRKAKIADPIGDVTSGEAQVALQPVTMPDAEIAAAEDNAETKAEAEGAGYAEPSPEAETSPEAAAAIAPAAQEAAKGLKPEERGGSTPRAKKPKSKRALQSAEESLALKGHDFSRAVSATKESPALAAEGRFSPILDEPISETPPAIPAAPEINPEDETPEDIPDSDEAEPETKPRPPAKLDRLQKILAQAGVASRRKAEEMIEQGRVQINGKVVTVLGTKADAARDHIRVDGKLLQGAERLRYFVLNKPRGFVTTVKDPEGRPTVMQFFDKMRERLYPVGRLDYMSEGLLLVTNDGELANRLTRAAAGVEKTYLVKVAGIPSEAELDQLRSGVAIERGKPGSTKVRTSPARIRQVRQGDNPWYEVILIEGRNRELRKMFEEVGHFVEKIRRVGYGPLILDQEPGNLRELDPQELALLRQAADGTLRTPKSKDVRRRNLVDAGQLPTVAPRATAPRPAKPLGSRPAGSKSFEERPAAGPKDYRPKRSFDTDRPARPGGPARPAGKDFRAGRPSGVNRSSSEGYRPNKRPSARPAWQKDDRPARPTERFDRGSSGESRPPAGKSYGSKPFASKPYAAKPFAKKPFESKPFEARPAAGRAFGSKPPSNRPFAAKPAGRPYGDRPAGAKPFAAKPGFSKPAWNKSGPSGPKDRPPFKRPPAPRAEARVHDDDFGPVRPPNLRIEEIHGPDRSSPSRPATKRPSGSRSGAPYGRPGRPSPDRPRSDRPTSDRPRSDRSSPARPSQGRPASGRPSTGRPSSARPFRSEGGQARPFTTSSGKPRAGGARPSSKPGSSGYKGKPSGKKRR
jgi:23S rRNA pseudouridine2605 synthase